LYNYSKEKTNELLGDKIEYHHKGLLTQLNSLKNADREAGIVDKVDYCEKLLKTLRMILFM